MASFHSHIMGKSYIDTSVTESVCMNQFSPTWGCFEIRSIAAFTLKQFTKVYLFKGDVTGSLIL